MRLRLWTRGCLAALGIALSLPAAETLTGAGATFPLPLYQKWFATFQKVSPDVAIEYRAVGSGEGIEAFSARDVDFGASDYPLSDERLANRKVWQVPTVVGAVVPVYHLEKIVEDLRFTPETLAGIYLGKIRRWNDPALKAINRGVALPDREIVVIHRSDASGTTYIWTDYLSKVSDSWRSAAGVGDTVNWPVGTGAPLNEGVADLVARTPDSIGYVQFIYAITHKLDYGAVRNRAGRFIQADLPSLRAAAEDFQGGNSGDLRQSITNAPGRDSYPIASLTFFLVAEDLSKSAKWDSMLRFLSWMLTTGQNQAASLGYVALPSQTLARARTLIEEMRASGGR